MATIQITATELDTLFTQAVDKCGPRPNALGFLRRVHGSIHYRTPPVNPGRFDSGYAASAIEIQRAAAEFRLALRVGHWPTV